MHEEYRKHDPCYYDLTESDTIKNILKKVNIKGIKKCSKVGKTAIAFKNESDAMKLLKHLDEGTYFICDMNGTEIIEQSMHFIKNVSRIKKLERVLSDEFSLDIN
jgi:ribosomal 30S subunit maturation factor RimM